MNDGIPLGSAAHPQPKWYVRPYWSFRCLWTYWFGFRKGAIETVCRDKFSTEPFRYRLRVPGDNVLNKAYGTKGK